MSVDTMKVIAAAVELVKSNIKHRKRIRHQVEKNLHDAVKAAGLLDEKP